MTLLLVSIHSHTLSFLSADPPTRAAILHLTALRQHQDKVANLLTSSLVQARFKAEWVLVAPVPVPWRRLATKQSVYSLAATEWRGDLMVAFLEWDPGGPAKVSIWFPRRDEIRSRDFTACDHSTRLSFLTVTGKTLLAIHNGGHWQRLQVIDPETPDLVSVYEGINWTLSAMPSGAALCTAEGDFEGNLYIRQPGAPPMFEFKEDPQTHEKNPRRTEASRDEEPIAVLPSWMWTICPVTHSGQTTQLVIVAEDEDASLYIVDLLDKGLRREYPDQTFSRATLLKSGILQGQSALAVFERDGRSLAIVSPHDGQVLFEFDPKDFEKISKAQDVRDVAFLDLSDGSYLLICTSAHELLCWSLTQRKFTLRRQLDGLSQLDTVTVKGKAYIVTGHKDHYKVNVWDAQHLLNRDDAQLGETRLLVSAQMGNRRVAAFVFIPEGGTPRINVVDIQDGERIYEKELRGPSFSPYFVALCDASDGLVVIVQSNWFEDVIEIHHFASGEEPQYAFLPTRPSFSDYLSRLAERSEWTTIDALGQLRLVAVTTSQPNRRPSTTFEALMSKLFDDPTLLWHEPAVAYEAVDQACKGFVGSSSL